MSKSKITIDLQNELNLAGVPDVALMQRWVVAALQQSYAELEQTIRVVDEAESQQLNKAYRSKDRPTNVLSFPAEDSEFLDYEHLGDLVICAPVVASEAQNQYKTQEAHWAHMIVHGMLHLQGFDHIDDDEVERMERLEIEILSSLGHTNPYLLKD
jgi:probable rRNA maturation factor